LTIVPILGTIVPIVGTIDAGLFGSTRSALLALLFGHTDQSFYVRQIARALGGGHGALQRELKHLTAMGLIVRTMSGNQVLYQANPRSPIFSEVRGLVAKTVGVHDTIRYALATLADKIQVAFVYGSVARRMERNNSDIDLMVLGEALFSEVVSALSPAQKALGREINPTVFPVLEFRSKLQAGNHFLQNVKNHKKLFVIGTQREFAKLATK
jgi:predicted nucleotidyltransferase